MPHVLLPSLQRITGRDHMYGAGTGPSNETDPAPRAPSRTGWLGTGWACAEGNVAPLRPAGGSSTDPLPRRVLVAIAQVSLAVATLVPKHSSFSRLDCMSAQTVEDRSVAEFERAAEMLKLLAEPTRLRIMWAMSHEHSINREADHLVAGSVVSSYLAKLRIDNPTTTELAP